MQNFDIQEITIQLQNASDIKELQKIYNSWLGVTGLINLELKKMKDYSNEERKKFGPQLNILKNQINEVFYQQKQNLEIINEDQEIFDPTLSCNHYPMGSSHIIHETIQETKKIFQKLGFIHCITNEIEEEKYNFNLLNIDKLHPARQMQDTFYLQQKNMSDNNYLLRTHTSSIQLHSILKYNKKPPMAIIATGKVFRKDWDATHTPMFHQIDGFMIDNDINFSNMKWCITKFLEEFFEQNKIKVRFRMSYFPFTEPSCEADISIDNGKTWLEILGCGMIHRNVLKNMNIDHEKYKGFAFGIGIERITMLKHHIQDLRNFYKISLYKKENL